MKNRKLLTLAAAAALAVGVLAGCGNAKDSDSVEGSTANTEKTENEFKDASGKITMAGSTSMEKFANALSEAFMEKNPDVTVTAEFTGSSAGIESLLGGSVDIGNSSRRLEDEEKKDGAVENIVAIDGIAVVTDKENPVENLTKEDLTKVYTGEITNWKALGGKDQSIVVIGREAGSGTRGAFEEILGVEEKCVYANELDSTGAVMAKAASTPGAVGYVSLDVLDNSVNAVKLDDVEPTAENIKAGKYFLQRPFVMATKGEISEQSEQVQAFFDYLGTEEGKALVESVGLITAD